MLPRIKSSFSLSTSAETIIETLKPVQDKYFEYLADTKYLDEVLLKGKLKAEKKAKETIDRLYNKLGLIR